MTTCKNCSQTFEGNYCPQCGQKASTKRFSTRILFSELIDKIFPLDRGVLFTARHLLTRPGAMLRDYLDGKRAHFTKPIQFLLVMVAISLIFFSSDAMQQGFQDGFSNGSNDAAKNEFSQKMGQWISANMTALIVGILPFMALVARWFFRKRGINYAEHFVVSCYLIGGSTLMGMPFMLVAKVSGLNIYSPKLSFLFGLIYVFYCVWGYISLFKTHSAWSTGLKGILVVLLGYLLYIFVAMVLGVLAALAYFSITGMPQ
jgi:hypothetical protein